MQPISPDYWENFIAILLAFAVLALIVERALYQIFDSNLWAFLEKRFDEQIGGNFLDLKPWIATAVSIWVVYKFQLDMIAMLFNQDEPRFLSLTLTGLFLAGGSTGIYKFLKKARQIKEAIENKPN